MALRLYTLSDFRNSDAYRLSVKRESTQPEQPDAPAGLVSNYLHEVLAVGDEIEARWLHVWRVRRPLREVAGWGGGLQLRNGHKATGRTRSAL